MNDLTDQQLLQDYVNRRSEAAFTELVRRHIDHVHSSAFRMTGEAHSAQDVTQAVFVALAQKAVHLTQHPVLSGWLHTTARNVAAKHVRTTVRRQHHEQEAAAMNELLSAAPDDLWDEIAPCLDATLGELSEPDRDAVMLRYFEKKSASEMAAQLGISDDAAQKRVSRAVERLRELFAKRGVTVGASGLAVVISANAVQAAPAGLVLTISTAAALTGTTLATTATITATKAIAMTALQKTIVTATIAVLAGVGLYKARQASQLRDQVQTLQQQQAPLAAQIQQLQSNWNDATNRLALLAEENKRLNRNSNELIRLRGEVGGLRRVAKEPAQSKPNQYQPAGAAIGQNILNYAVAQINKDGTNSVEKRIVRLSEKLNLAAEQQQQLRDTLMANVDSQTQIMIAGYRGDLSPEEANRQANKIAEEEDQAINAVLTQDQTSAYLQMKIDEASEASKSFVTRELAAMKALKISPEQAEQATSILSSLKPGAGGPSVLNNQSSAKEQLELRLQALETVLTPKQLEDYRQMKLKSIEQIIQQNQEVSNLFRTSK